MKQPTGTVTLVFTDVEGSTRLLHELGAESFRDALGEHRRIVRAAFARRDGYEVDYEGDAFFYAFSTAGDALAAVREALAGLEPGPIRIRVGIHTGEPIPDPPKYIGLDVHRAARIMSAAHGGQVLLSATTRELVDADVVDLGEHVLKDIDGTTRLYQAGAGEFPPLRTLNNTNLPIPVSSFLGREAELTAAEPLLASSRLLTVTGPGGTGKTRFAVELAARRLTDFPDGVFWVPLAPLRDPSLVLETAAQALRARDGLVEHVGDKRMLLVLDNFEQVVDAAPELHDVLASCPNLTALVTSRELLHVQGEREYALAPLETDEAVALFCDRAAVEGSDAIDRLCARLDNLPLAIELAAARAKLLTPEQLLDRLSDRLDLLKGGRDADPRQQTLRATIEWSYDLLAPEEQSLFSRLGVFAGGCTLDAAEDIVDADLDPLGSLVDKSLVRRTDNRFWMLETIREYAAEHCAETGELPSLRRRHAGWYIELAERAEPQMWQPEQQMWAERLDAEHDNLRAALGWCLDTSDWDGALRLAGAMEPYWEARGHIAEGRRWLDRALTASVDASPGVRAKALFGASRLVIFTDYPREAAYLEEAVALFRQAGDVSGLVFALAHLGQCAGRLGDHARARLLLEEAAVTARSLDDDWLLAMVLNNLGCALMGQGELAGARPALEESLALRRGLGEKRGVAVTLTSVGELALASREFADATPPLEEALELAREIGNKPLECWSIAGLGLAELYQGDLARAKPTLIEGLRLAAELDDREVIGECLAALAAVAECIGDIPRAARLWGASERVRAGLGTPPMPQAVELHERFLAAFRSRNDPAAVAAAWREGEAMSRADAVDYALSERR